MRIVACGSAQSTLNAERIRVFKSALPGKKFVSPQCGHLIGRPAIEHAAGCVPSLNALAPPSTLQSNVPCAHLKHPEHLENRHPAHNLPVLLRSRYRSRNIVKNRDSTACAVVCCHR